MKVPFLDLRASYKEIKPEIDDSIRRVLDSGIYISGQEVELFENEFAAYVGANYCVGVSTGLSALELALIAAGIGPGDEVIVPHHTFIATWLAVSNVGAIPVGIEPTIGTFLIDYELIEDLITPRTKAIIPVHLYGHPVNLNKLHKIAKQHQLIVIEDAAQAHGARFEDVPIGSHSEMVCWSFYPGKNLGAFGDGGAITTNNQLFATKLRSLGNYGSKIKYEHDEIGTNSRLDPIQAAILRVKLGKLDSWNLRRKNIASKYFEQITSNKIIHPIEQPWATHSWHLYVVRVDKTIRNSFRNQLQKLEIDTMVHYPIPVSHQKAYGQNNAPLSHQLSQEIVSLPMGPHLSDDQVDFVINEINKYLK